MVAAPAISVILPNYNHAPFLAQRIESILDQTRGDFELLILDDCSPDISREVIARYTGDPRVRTAFNETNSGNTYLQWRKGLGLTTGAYIWIAESDDFSDVYFLERVAAKLDADPAVGLAFCETMVVDAQGQDIQPASQYWRDLHIPGFDADMLDREFTMAGRDYIHRLMVPVNTIPNASAVLFRRSALEAIGGPVLDMRLCGDWLTYCRILADHAVAHVPQRMNCFRDHQSNVRSALKGETFVDESFAVTRWIEAHIGPPSPIIAAYLRTFYAQAVLNIARFGHDKVPLARVPAALKRAKGMRRELVLPVAAMLARESLAGIARKVGLRRS